MEGKPGALSRTDITHPEDARASCWEVKANKLMARVPVKRHGQAFTLCLQKLLRARFTGMEHALCPDQQWLSLNLSLVPHSPLGLSGLLGFTGCSIAVPKPSGMLF